MADAPRRRDDSWRTFELVLATALGLAGVVTLLATGTAAPRAATWLLAGYAPGLAIVWWARRGPTASAVSLGSFLRDAAGLVGFTWALMSLALASGV